MRVLGACVLTLLGSVPLLAQETPKPQGNRHALLVGCTFYEHLDAGLHLEGPANDVVLMRDLLIGRFQFPKDNVVTLAEQAGKDRWPTRQHIAREFQRLAQVVKPGDQVVILLGGHGSQQPDQPNPADPDDFEPDGLDEIFLPRDAGPWDGSKGEVKNAIRDDELRAWIKAIQDKKASIWLIIDACHSGSMMRGADEEKLRQVSVGDPTKGFRIPKAALELAEKRATERGALKPEKTRGTAQQASPFKLNEAPALVALYAAQSIEPTVERKLPPDAADRKPYGLLTFTLNQLLTQSATPLTYRELSQRIQAQYVRWGRSFPTPLLEGKDQDREVLGLREWPGRSRLVLQKGDDGWQVNGGSVHGLTADSILAVYPPAGQAGTEPLGHVRLHEVDAVTAEVEPVAHGKTPLRKDLPLGGRCELVYVDYGVGRLPLAVDGLDNLGKAVPPEARQRLEQTVQQLGKEPGSLVLPTADAGKAAWVLRWQAGQVYLVPASGWSTASAALPPLFGPYPLDDKLPLVLQENLGRIARAENLKKLAAASAAEVTRGGQGVKVEIELRRLRSKTDAEGVAVPWPSAQVAFFDGDRVEFRLRNPNPFPIDVSLLYVDSAYGITCLYPEGGELNRLGPKESVPTRIRVTGDTAGLEHMVVLAVKAAGQPVDFAGLAQPSLEAARNVERTRAAQAKAQNSLETPLGQLLQHSLYGAGKTRGAARETVGDHALNLLSWRVLAQKRPPDAK